jgi:hypothetical protein
MPQDACQIQVRSARDGSGKQRLLTREALDGRTRAHKKFDAIAAGIVSDLGGEDRLSTVTQHLVEAFAGTALHVGVLNARLLLGEKIDIIEYSQVISTLVRLASRIGIHRLARDVTPLPLEYGHDAVDAASAADAADEGAT